MTRRQARRQDRGRWRWRFLRVLVVGALVVAVLAWRERQFSQNQHPGRAS